MNKKRITLVALVVTIIVLLILVSITIAITLGPNGVIQKANAAKLDSRYSAIMDKVKVRETDIEIAFQKNEAGEDATVFVNKLRADSLVLDDEPYEASSNILRIEKNLMGHIHII